MKKFAIVGDLITKGGSLTIKPRTGDVIFINKGTKTAIISPTGLQLLPGESLTIGANEGEENTTAFKFGFSTTGDNAMLYVIRKIFQDGQ